MKQYPLPQRKFNTPTLTLPVPSLTRKSQNSEIDELCKLMRRRYDDQQIAEIYSAYHLAAEGHTGQNRVSGEPYIFHPIAVAKIVFEMNMDYRSVIAALLHDVVEDTTISLEQIEAQFGEDVAVIVDGLSKLTHLKFKSKAEAQAANFQKMLLAMVDDIRVILIKLADRIHNMRTLGAMPDHKRRRIARETLEVYAPIANRLGIYQMKNELEDLGFKSLYPARHRVLTEAVKKRNTDRRALVRKFEILALAKLEDAGIEAEVHGREKHLYSLYQKMRSKRSAFEDVFDMFAVRIIVKNQDDCYRTLGVMHSLHNPLPRQVKDYIAIPKSNGYQSLHTVLFSPAAVPIEVQIRTQEMNTFAETGVAAHWMYKEGQANSAQQRAHQWLANLVDMRQDSADTLEFYENVKVDLFPYEIFVFSPMGDIYRLPQGATAVDFAYLVHSDIGNRCLTAKIDRKLAPLSKPLESGQTVEIICSDTQQPNAYWLNFVVTPKARNAIRNYLKNQSTDKTIGFGKQLLGRGLKRYRTSIDNISEASIRALLKQMNIPDLNTLFYEIGLGNHIPSMVAAWLLNAGNQSVEIEQPMQLPSEADPGPLVVEGGEDAIVSLARCCMPIPGDNIQGMITAGKGVMVHRADCKNVSRHQRRSKEWVTVVWGADSSGPFQTTMLVDIDDVPGALAKVANVMSEMDTNIEDIRFERGGEKITTLVFTLSVRDRVHLGRLIKRVRSLKATVRARRATA
ncbi:bifunctional GTP diphosphokinase/guanosine-3',5'-bis(diphosphate) 3'-diphosphatase [Chromatiales bacterium (ex Bugula neritina AB1)]|nr:bifunctional GTP diphosphokinase/guanosine-3',5'-bis(diphosphate) 3'-diphosphatase [Chromatiales bacterium (ex Bugula neritina AB1)]